MQSIRIASRPPWEKGSETSWANSEEHQPKYIPIYRKDWSHFDVEPRVQGKQQMEDQQCPRYLFLYLACLTILSSN